MKNPSIGKLRDRVTLEKPAATPDGGGGETVTWTTVKTVWADVEPVVRPEQIQAGRRVNPVEYEITMRRRTDIAPDWRVKFLGRSLAIRSMTPIGARRLYLVLTCVGGLE